MFENRSFDHLLGRLYEPGEVESFEGVIGKDLSNPIPEWAEHGADRGVVRYGVAKDMNTPYPDPGEEYPHINTQLYGRIDPPSNRGVPAEQMIAPYNAPADPDQVPTMDGFVADYISAFTAEMGRQPTYDEYSQIMTGYTPEQMPVLSTLARGFATFDHWFADVPSQTFTNRSFFHAATASGLVINAPYANFPVHNTAETLFDRLDAHGLTWRVYCDPPSRYSLTGLIHAPRLREKFATHFFSTDQFFADAHERRAADLRVHRAADHRARPQRHAPRVQHAGPRPELRPAVVADRRRGPARPDLRRDPIIVVARPGRTASTRCSWSSSTNTAAPTTTSRRPPPPRPTRPHRPGRWTSPSTDSASACRRSRSRHGSPSRPSSTTPTATRR